MMEFFASVSWFGWLLIALALCTLWQLPAILRMMFQDFTSHPDRKMQPGEDPPHLSGAAPMRHNTHDHGAGSDPQ